MVNAFTKMKNEDSDYNLWAEKLSFVMIILSINNTQIHLFY